MSLNQCPECGQLKEAVYPCETCKMIEHDSPVIKSEWEELKEDNKTMKEALEKVSETSFSSNPNDYMKLPTLAQEALASLKDKDDT